MLQSWRRGLVGEHPRSTFSSRGRDTRLSELREGGRHGVDVQVYPNDGGSYRWRRVAENGAMVATSGESFDSKANASRTAENVKENAAGASVEQSES
jgi:uncharacterized protein YegP (UPF0339 family)